MEAVLKMTMTFGCEFLVLCFKGHPASPVPAPCILEEALLGAGLGFRDSSQELRASAGWAAFSQLVAVSLSALQSSQFL